MLLASHFWFLILVPLLVLGQNNASVTTFTSLSTFVTVVGGSGGHTESTGTSTFVFTSTLTAAPANGTSATNSTSSGNSTNTNTNSTTTSSTPTTLPTAPSTIAGGGGPNGVAPSPGASGGIYGPNDSYIAAALSLQINTLVVGLCGIVVGGILVAV